MDSCEVLSREALALIKIRRYYLNELLAYNYTKRTILLRDKNILLDTDLKIILLDYQNNFVGTLKIGI